MPKRKSARRTSKSSSVSSVDTGGDPEHPPTSEHVTDPASDRLVSVGDVGEGGAFNSSGGGGEEPANKKLKSEDTGGEETEGGDVFAGGVSEGDAESAPSCDPQEQNEDSDLSDAGSDGEESDDEDYMDVDEIDALLDQGMADYKKTNAQQEEPVEKEKVVLIEKVNNPFEMLPDGWVIVSHNSGMPVFLHKELRVCTLSKPYFLGSGSARKHAIPVSAVPCMEYRKALEKEKEDLENHTEKETTKPDASEKTDGEKPAGTDGGDNEKKDGAKPSPTALSTTVEVKVAEDHDKENSLEPEELRKYCEALFQFKTIKFKRFNTWKERRISMKKEKKKSRPTLPSNTKLITCPLPAGRADEKSNRKNEFVLNPEGKTPVCLMHEYVQKVLRLQPKYTYKDTDLALTPYSATVIINGIEYGTGVAANKKQAKQEAAKKALSVLMPEVKEFDDSKDVDSNDLSFFDEIKIEDPRIKDLSTRAGQNGPFAILMECLRRNYGLGDTDIKTEITTLKNQKCEYKMTAGKHSTTVTCKNKRDGKQLAAQCLLQMLHPQLSNWGSVLRLYGRSVVKIEQDKKRDQASITNLQRQFEPGKPNEAVLSRLREEMFKLGEKKPVVPKVEDFAQSDSSSNIPKSVSHPTGVDL